MKASNSIRDVLEMPYARLPAEVQANIIAYQWPLASIAAGVVSRAQRHLSNIDRYFWVQEVLRRRSIFLEWDHDCILRRVFNGWWNHTLDVMWTAGCLHQDGVRL